MPGKNPAEAFDNFVRPIQQALSCVTPAVLRGSHDARRPGGVRAVAVPVGGTDYVTLPGDRGLRLMMGIEYEIVEVDDPDRGRWKVRTRQYRYHVVNADHTEVILFHWHPEGASDRKLPHLHLGSSQLTPSAVLTSGAHIPTERVSFESVIRLLIVEFGVPARRDDWSKVLDDGEAAFERWRTWP